MSGNKLSSLVLVLLLVLVLALVLLVLPVLELAHNSSSAISDPGT